MAASSPPLSPCPNDMRSPPTNSQSQGASPPFPLAPPLRVGTFNVGLAFVRKLPAILSRCAELRLDLVALQEIGDPALHSARLPPYTLVHQPSSLSSQHDGVGLLISAALMPRVLSYKRSDSGRLIGVVFQLTPGRTLLVVSVYMPTGLDRRAFDSPEAQRANDIYREILRWSVGMDQVLVLGDLNETRSCHDRLPLPHPLPRAGLAAAAEPRPIDALLADGFTDTYRELHPHPELNPGHTHTARGEHGLTSSRIDYILRRGFPAGPLPRVEIDAHSLRQHSHHSLLWSEMQLGFDTPPPCSDPLYRMRLPNLRAATESHKEAFAQHAHRRVQAEHDALAALTAAADAASLDCLASRLTALVRESATVTMPATGAPTHRSADVLRLRQQECDLRYLIRIAEAVLQLYAVAGSPPAGNCFSRSPKWLQAQARCARFHDIRWRTNAWNRRGDPREWLRETRELLRQTRSAIRREMKRMSREPRAPLHVSPAAQVHRMLDGDSLPAQLLTVVRADGSLTSGAAELEHELVDHFRSVFALPREVPAALPHPPPQMLFEKSTVSPAWYAGLDAAMQPQEILDALADAPLISSPGEDKVSTGLWKLALQGSPLLCSLVSRLFTGLLVTSSFPSAWKTSVIVPLVKDASKPRSRGNLRPISLQACLGKLFMQILARRLGSVLASHPILHPAQRGFVLGGSIAKCIDELLDAWDWARKGGHALYTLLYDIRQAYDSVQREVLERAMRRLRMPEPFISLVVASLEGLSSRVRTAYDLSAPFDVERSLRQGDPLAPLLFVILMDALHCGLETNPFTNKQHGLVMRLAGVSEADSPTLPSLGYADDTSANTGSLEALRVQNDWVHYFMLFNRMRLNHAKCELIGQGPDGLPVTEAELAAAGITIEGHPLVPVAHTQAIRYLGVQCRFDGSWAPQRGRALGTLLRYTRLIDKFRVPLALAAYIVNVFLLPKLELALRYVIGVGAARWLQVLDRALVASMQHAAGLPLTPSSTIVALTLGFALPSWLETSIKVSELFLRMNSTECRWGRQGRQLMRIQQPAASAAEHAPRLLNSDTHIQRACKLAACKLGWQVRLNPEPSRRSRNPHMFHRLLSDSLPGLDECSGTQMLTLPSGEVLQAAHDLWHGWGAAVPVPAAAVHVYTDGSHDPSSLPLPTSSWAVTVCDGWLRDNYQRLPVDEQQLKARSNEALLRKATMLGSSITCTCGIYPAELQAIARTLAIFPVSCPLHLYSDSQGALAGIVAYERELNERQRLRMAARPLLQLIHHLLAVRTAHGASTEWSHVKAHTQSADLPSVGNRLSDYQANTVRQRPEQPAPLCLQQLPLDKCENHLCLFEQPPGHAAPRLLSDDIRRTALAQLRASEQARKQSEMRTVSPASADDHQTRLFGPEVLDLGLVVRRRGSPAQQCALLRVATNSMHLCWQPLPRDAARPVPPGPPKQSLRPLPCKECRCSMSVAHLICCLAPKAMRFRAQLLSAVLALLRSEPCTAQWLSDNRGLSVGNTLRKLFPPCGPAAAHDERTYMARLLCGAFPARSGPAAIRALGFASSDSGRALLESLRLLCLERIDAFYGRLKEAAAVHTPP